MLIKRLYTICLFVLSLCVNTAMAQHIESFNDALFCPATSVQPATGLIGLAEISWQVPPSEVTIITQDDDRSVFDEKRGSYIFNALRRLKSVDQCASMGISPDYVLVTELAPPSLMMMALTPSVLPPFQSHWISEITSSHHRLSGWKEGNLLYSHRFG
ncbi:hypothetical protein [Photobacterium lutimaris]|uniref:Uncharacterized protein n=1 Tax=Photobacterium lutimaris TaxID=388278 RepID=A0A2T3ILT6_9GAMM|nr:hypothetical protein [Photobacterium lutimaris]PSU29308.1 hypothetical protein C9I99_25125 [Photobacterium lutimaris]TDR70583.1 hypothetical protein DFP78_12025 [Photobacterium lutimaris]